METAYIEGTLKGEREGLLKGKREGRLEGRREGRLEKQIETVIACFHKKLPVVMIADIVSLSEAEVTEILRNQGLRER
jgi:predicted transposase YdaD